MTAEGDNRVLMQKVSKELLTRVDKSKVMQHAIMKMQPLFVRRLAHRLCWKDFTDASVQLEMFRFREQWCLNDLAAGLHAHRKQGKSIFEAWMLHESDLVQALATAYGERVALEQIIRTTKGADHSIAHTLDQLRNLFALDRIRADQAFFLREGLLFPHTSVKVG